MALIDTYVRTLEFNRTYFVMSLADFSDAELMQRPVPGANHANWQLGHLVVQEVKFMKAAGAAMPELPAGFAEKYRKETAGVDDAKAFATKEELVRLFEQGRAATIAFAKGLSVADLERESGIQIAPSVSETLMLMANHVSMHWGQMQVLRRRLGKPVMF